MNAEDARKESDRLNTLATLEKAYIEVTHENQESIQLRDRIARSIIMECREELRPTFAECVERINNSEKRIAMLKELLNQTHPEVWTPKARPSDRDFAYRYVKAAALHPGVSPTPEELEVEGVVFRELCNNPDFWMMVIPLCKSTTKSKKGKPITVPKGYRKRDVLERIKAQALDAYAKTTERFGGVSYAKEYIDNHPAPSEKIPTALEDEEITAIQNATRTNRTLKNALDKIALEYADRSLDAVLDDMSTQS